MSVGKLLSLTQILLIILLNQLSGAFSSLQNIPQRTGPPPWTMVNSPELHSDGTVSFRIWAPKANKISLESELIEGKQFLLTKENDDIWSIRVTPTGAGLFKYRFLVDDVITIDPTNSITDETWSLLYLKGKEADFYTVQHVPHGALHQHFYFSRSLQSERPCQVYTPPDYYNSTNKNYPVLFLLHGSGGTDDSWVRTGKVNVILDNLIAQGLAKSMIVVMPFGHTVEPGTSGWPFVKEKGDFIQDFFQDLLPFVEKLYRMSTKSEDKAIAGFSMGGYHTLKIGLNHLEQFDYLGVFSWGTAQKWFKENVPGILMDPEKVNSNLKQFWIACGRNDFLFERAQKLDEALTQLNIKHTFFVSDRGHTMINWRQYLFQYAQLIFQE